MWWVTVSVVRPGRSCDRALERLEQQLAPAEVEPGGGLVEREQRRVGDQPAREHDPRALALRAAREEPRRERAGADRVERACARSQRAGGQRLREEDRAREAR